MGSVLRHHGVLTLTSKSLIIWGICLLAGLAPARAAIFHPEADTDGDLLAESASHKAGAEHRALVRIYLAGGKISMQESVGTGVYIGPGRDGRRGLLLTAAHLFEYDPVKPEPLPYDRVYAEFGPDPAEAKGKVRVEARRVLLPVGYTTQYFGSLAGAGRRRDPEPSIRHDLALVEFDLAPVAADLEAAGIAPAHLHGAGEHRGLELQAAMFLGYGCHGTTADLLFPSNERVHLGRTLVSSADYCGREVLVNLAPMCGEAMRRFRRGEADMMLLYRFSAQASPREACARTFPGSLWLATHPGQAVPSPGDSGGPLLVRAADGTLRVAGVSSGTARHRVRLAPWRKQRRGWALMTIFEPVGPHRDWIERMREDKAGRRWVLEPGEGAWRCAPREETDTCSLCTIM